MPALVAIPTNAPVKRRGHSEAYALRRTEACTPRQVNSTNHKKAKYLGLDNPCHPDFRLG